MLSILVLLRRAGPANYPPKFQVDIPGQESRKEVHSGNEVKFATIPKRFSNLKFTTAFQLQTDGDAASGKSLFYVQTDVFQFVGPEF